MELYWSSMELEVLLLNFHGIPWNHRCCSNVVQKVPWNSGENMLCNYHQIFTHSMNRQVPLSIPASHENYEIWYIWGQQFIAIYYRDTVHCRQSVEMKCIICNQTRMVNTYMYIERLYWILLVSYAFMIFEMNPRAHHRVIRFWRGRDIKPVRYYALIP